MTEEILPRTAGNGLAPGDSADPREGPFTLEERAEAADALCDERRWFTTKDKTTIDLLAMRLQVGRGRTYVDVCQAFGMLENSLLRRRRTDSAWSRSLSERDRRDLARRIHLAGLERLARGEHVDPAALKAASEWRVAPRRNLKPLWTSLGDDGPEASSGAFQETFHDHSEDDPSFHERQRVRERLDALIRKMERDAADRFVSAAAAGDDAAGGPAVASGETAQGTDGDARREPA